MSIQSKISRELYTVRKLRDRSPSMFTKQLHQEKVEFFEKMLDYINEYERTIQ